MHSRLVLCDSCRPAPQVRAFEPVRLRGTRPPCCRETRNPKSAPHITQGRSGRRLSEFAGEVLAADCGAPPRPGASQLPQLRDGYARYDRLTPPQRGALLDATEAYLRRTQVPEHP